MNYILYLQAKEKLFAADNTEKVDVYDEEDTELKLAYVLAVDMLNTYVIELPDIIDNLPSKLC